MTAVEFRDIPGFPGYRVGDDGSVWSKLRRGPGVAFGPWREMKPSRTGGYRSVVLYRGGKRADRRVPRLVLEAFVGPCPPGMEACHKADNDRANNRLGNLAWGTQRENMADRDRHGATARGERCRKSELTDAAVVEIRLASAAGVPQRALAAKFGVDQSSINRIALGKAWRHIPCPSLT